MRFARGWLLVARLVSTRGSPVMRLLHVALLLASSAASAIVIRHDRSDTDYLVPATELPALVDLPGEGHGVLVAPQWVITAAHAVTWQSAITSVTLNGSPRDVERIVIHPGYKRPAQELIHQVLTTGDATLLRVLLASSDDIALIRLKHAVADVTPLAIYKGNDQFGQITKIIGKGATGTGATGYDGNAPHRSALRRAFNRISSAEGRWFCHVFDEAPSALPLEGTTGSGDSGGAALLQVGDHWQLAGLPSWASAHGHAATMRQGRYGQTSCNVRLSHYLGWIESTLNDSGLEDDGTEKADRLSQDISTSVPAEH